MIGAEQRTKARVDKEARKFFLAHQNAPINADWSEQEQSLWSRGRELYMREGFAAIDRDRGEWS